MCQDVAVAVSFDHEEATKNRGHGYMVNKEISTVAYDFSK